MLKQPTSVDDVLQAFGGVSEVAAILGKGYSTVSEMKRRGNIPPAYWPALIEAAKAKAIPEEITADSLLRVHTPPATQAAE
ncbi:MAG: carph-isopro domain-containing protein [Beijerinckiaceae bacterium]